MVAVAGCLVLEDEATLLGSNVGGLSREGLEEISVHSAAASLLATSTTRTRERSLLPRAMLRLGLVQAATVVVVVCVALALAQVNPNVYPRTRVFDTSSGPVQGAYSISQ